MIKPRTIGIDQGAQKKAQQSLKTDQNKLVWNTFGFSSSVTQIKDKKNLLWILARMFLNISNLRGRLYFTGTTKRNDTPVIDRKQNIINRNYALNGLDMITASKYSVTIQRFTCKIILTEHR